MPAWNDFYLLIGGASASLVGLLFVGLSQHLRVVIANPDVLRLARQTFLTFLSVVLVAAIVLLAGQGHPGLGTELFVIGLVGAASVLAGNGKAALRRAWDFGAFLATRIGVNVLAYLSLTAAGLMLQSGDTAVLNWLAAAVLILVATACYNSWDLLVTLGAEIEHRRQTATHPLGEIGSASESLAKVADEG